ncbi:24664_t:CDS:2, partial [Dentiscutata erythropus]
QHQETVSIQTTKLQDMYNNLNTIFQETFFTLSMNILEIQNKVIEYIDDQKNILNILEDIRSEHSHEPLLEIINPKNKSIKNSTQYSTSHPTLWNSIYYKINDHQNSANIDKPSSKDYNKRSENLRQSLSDIEKVIKPEYTSPEISGSPSSLCIEVNQDYERFDNLKTHLSVAPNSDDINDGIWPAWALPDNRDDADHNFESDN